MAIVSSSRNAPAVLRAAKMIDFFPVIVDGKVAAERGLAGKPQPDTFLDAAAQLGVPKERAVVFEDALSGVAAGRAGDFGLVIGVDRGVGPDKLLENGADVVVNDLEELLLSGPSHVAPQIHDFLDRSRYPVDEWSLVETHIDSQDLGTTETLFSVGNGYLGLRGNVDEGRDSYSHGTYINGFHETWPIQHAEEAFGFARVGQTIVNAPDAKVIRLYVDDEPLLLQIADLMEYERRLDFRTGVMSREILWRTPGGKRVQIRSRRMVSFTQRHLAILTFEVTMLDDYAPVAISSQILNRQDGEDEYHVRSKAMGEGVDPRKASSMRHRVLIPQSNSGNVADGRVGLGYQCAESGMTIAVAADHRLETANNYTKRIQTDDDLAKMTYRIDAEPGQPITLTKMVSYHTSRGVPSRELLDRCTRTLDRAQSEGLDQQLADQRQWLDDFWERSDVEVPGQPEVQQAVRWNLFQIAQASARAEGTGIPAKGVTGSGYGGHYFWDTEVYVLPFLTYTTPRAARNALRFRYTLLDAARNRAKQLAQQGALFPWRTINGEEASAYYAAGTAQYHIDADISYALEPVPRGHRRHRLPDPRGHRRARRDRPHVGRPRLLAQRGGRHVPHPRRDRPRRVHDRRQRQSLHQRHGALQPAPRRRGRTRAGDPRRRRVRPGRRPPRARRARGRRRGSAPPTTWRSPTTSTSACTRRTSTSSSVRCGTWRTRRWTSGRCCCTTTHW